jgi:predicted nucleotidyltransferase
VALAGIAENEKDFHGMDRAKLLERVKAGLSQAFGPRFRGLLLFGSEARGTARPDSDIDFLVLLAGPIERQKDLATIIDVVYPLEEELTGFRPISAIPVDEAVFEAQEWPLHINAKREGIPA